MKLPVVFLFLLPLLLSSCQQKTDQRPSTILSVKDDFDRLAQLTKTPRRIVSLAPSITETLFALDLDSSVVGVTDYCDFPEAALSKPRIGGMLNPNIERIVALKPDLVLMSTSGNMQTDYEKLTSIDLPVFVSNPRSIDGVLKAILAIGALTGRNTKAESLAACLRSQRALIEQQTAGKPTRRVLMLLSLNPIIAAGQGTFLDELITTVHGENIAHDSRSAYPVLSREEVLRRRPDIIIATNDIVKSPDAIISAYPEWRKLLAIQNRRVAIVDASLVSRPGPRIVVGLGVLGKLIHWEQ